MNTLTMLLIIWFTFISSTFSIKLLPDVKKIEVNTPKTLEISVNNLVEYIIYYRQLSARNPYRIKVSSKNADPQNPVLVVVRQEKDVISWELPLHVTTSKNQDKYYHVTSRTMCHNNMNVINTLSFRSFMEKSFHQDFTIGISSSCNINSTVSIETIEEENFFVKDGENVTLTVSPSQSRYFFYKFSSQDSDTLTIELNSNDDACLIVSIQDSTCPVFDLNEDIMFRGKYQTISRKGGLTIKRKDFSEGFFIVFVMKPDNYDCSQELSIYPVTKYYFERNSDATSNVSFVIRSSLGRKQYVTSTIVTMSGILFFYLVALVLIVAFRKYGSMKNINAAKEVISLDEDVVDDTLPRSTMDIVYVLEKPDLNVKVLTKYPLKDKIRSFNYLWHIISIAIFYSIPVVQLVIAYQRMLNYTGDEDLCYYNFLCAHPLFSFSDFNHIFSNIGYIFMGILFLFATFHRQQVLPFRFEVGIPVHYGLFYSMGIALIIEGLLSACYHMCPSQSNYQFARFLSLITINIINIGMLGIGLILYSKGKTDFGTFLLGLLMANAIVHALFYTTMKIIHNERICIEAIVYGVLGILSWIAATIFFLDAATLWTVTPAESRQWNQECILMNYYDKHDVWHLLSAPALYFTFMFLMCIDDDIIDKRQDNIPVF
ncbi:SID1 transmembrane family member 1-like isoform X3 [Harmonia axyridis]|uniref:SID1 transmembrane family member 1-like isoform X3 n=1 Tax=Harmonia axyridis TaxID=115357 RepID=UPI001E275CF6|nr:SID1 transmembrane family member 1-like isoform X3 [Harmonia axyridis]